jgi:hypothetical protein
LTKDIRIMKLTGQMDRHTPNIELLESALSRFLSLSEVYGYIGGVKRVLCCTLYVLYTQYIK